MLDTSVGGSHRRGAEPHPQPHHDQDADAQHHEEEAQDRVRCPSLKRDVRHARLAKQ